ncbi:MAG: glycosyltransferase WbuB [Gammaproteobacteria bacterium RIFCSPLOWO2_02_FULL_42_14]|nr:MAG: glycosyltransferase WbuB [Gammaproteobacteria bacterium RIFCSPHIGHO2_02_FULL_42_43]OGT27539.1 MAG: glycosyltransferase WbuB [Gammaproteobacteria bacterium RIFCSPHIGHO2_01_FULL_42_8]OGT51423.1 MAG: glycosyltransferase WbuB [Gammaproteobacteria bacterium RIFCSPHIGHO2_12_FULL_41_25]OGT62125.1 MAG: glycosyltransferase WbuB [Gammaproteobacteria bacterium RIFCSPLOWO2_02_FULL_42_14]OGT85797.1 MAG: glycosyltransferase WbuB [Gammaproteobacteria bacterium RIFCSPLOWO2_12_FULL_42_18]
MKILFITDNFYPEGNAIASRVYERACFWVKWGYQVTVITSAPNFPEGKLYPGYKNKWFQTEILRGIRVIRVKTFIKSNTGFLFRILDFLSFLPSSFLAGIRQDKPDVVVTTSPQFFGAISACLIAQCKRVPLILELGDIWPQSIVGVGAMRDSAVIRLLEKIELALYRASQKIVVVSPSFKDNLVSRGVNEKKIFTVMNGVDLTKFSPQSRNRSLLQAHDILPSEFIVGYIGTHGMAHALENILKTALLLQDQKNIRFIFVGAGAEKEKLIALSKNLKLSNVTFISAQPKEKIIHYWSLCNLALVHFKNSSVFSASIPSKIFEAMGMGLPILLSSPQGIASDIIQNEQVGLWVPAENPNDLANAILKLYNDNVLHDTFSKNSLLASKKYSRETQARDFLSVLNFESTYVTI